MIVISHRLVDSAKGTRPELHDGDASDACDDDDDSDEVGDVVVALDVEDEEEMIDVEVVE